MINVITHIHNTEQIEKYAALGCKKLVITTAFLSSGIEHVVNQQDISHLFEQAKKQEIQLGLLINRLIMESEWGKLIEAFSTITLDKPDFFVVNDVGVLHYLSTQTSKEIIFHSDTTIANPQDADVLLKHHASSIMPARELTFSKKLDIVKQHPTQTHLPLFGYQVMSKSYRPLLSNYFNEINSNLEAKFAPYYFKEEKRNHDYIGYEDDHGFCMFTHKIIHLFDQKEALEAANMTFGWIDSNFIESSMIETAIAYFHDQITKEEMMDQFILNNQDHLLDHGLNMQDTVLVKGKNDA